MTATKGPSARGLRLVDRAGHQLLAGAALPGDEHRRVGRRDLRGAAERVPEGGGLAEDPVEAVALLQGRLQGFDAALEPPGASLGEGEPPRLVGEPLVLEREHELGGDPAGNLDVGAIEPVGPAFAQVEAAPDPLGEPEGHAQDRAPAALDDEPIARPRGIELAGGVVEEDGLPGLDPLPEREVVEQDPGRRFLDGGVVHLGQDLHLAAAGREQRHSHDVEVEHRPDLVGQAVEDLADVEARAQHPGEPLDRLEPLAAPPLAIEQDGALDEGADQVGDAGRGGGVRLGVGAQSHAGEDQRPAHAAAGVEGHEQGGAEAGLRDPSLVGVGSREAGSAVKSSTRMGSPAKTGATPHSATTYRPPGLNVVV